MKLEKYKAKEALKLEKNKAKENKTLNNKIITNEQIISSKYLINNNNNNNNNKCNIILKTGKNKGNTCNKKIFNNGFCSLHYNKIIKL